MVSGNLILDKEAKNIQVGVASSINSAGQTGSVYVENQKQIHIFHLV